MHEINIDNAKGCTNVVVSMLAKCYGMCGGASIYTLLLL